MVYKSPGVTIREKETGTQVTLPNGARVPAIVGTGTATKKVSDVAVTRSTTADGSDVITGTITGEVSSLVGVGDLPGWYNYKANTDYVRSDNSVSWSPGGSEPTAGSTYYVAYNKVKSGSDYEPILFYNINDVRDMYGDELSGGVVNPITLGAYLAFKNGATAVICVQSQSSSASHLQDAIDKLKQEKDVYVVCCTNADTDSLQTYLANHVASESSESMKHERLAIIGPPGITFTVGTLVNRAGTLNSERVVLVSPPKMNVSLTDGACDTEQTVTLSGHYSACAIAGLICNPAYDEAEPWTRKSLSAIDDLAGTKYTETEKNTLGGGGVLVLDDDNGVIRIRHAVTTNTSNANKNSLSVVMTRDWFKKNLRSVLETGYIGTKILSSTTTAIGMTIKAFCEEEIENEIINAYRGISVEQDTSDPRTINVKLDISVVYPLEWIDITFSLYVA